MRILHVLDHSLPLHSGYTFRTRAILKAQMARGWDVACLTGARHQAASADPQTVDGIVFHRTPHRAGSPPLLREWREVRADRKSTRLNSSHYCATRMPSSACKTNK